MTNFSGSLHKCNPHFRRFLEKSAIPPPPLGHPPGGKPALFSKNRRIRGVHLCKLPRIVFLEGGSNPLLRGKALCMASYAEPPQGAPIWGPPKGVKKGVQRGVPKWVPQRSEPKKSRKIFFLWPQSTKKVTHVPVFEEKKIFLRKKNEKKNRPTGGCSPPGGTAWVV